MEEVGVVMPARVVAALRAPFAGTAKGSLGVSKGQPEAKDELPPATVAQLATTDAAAAKRAGSAGYPGEHSVAMVAMRETIAS